MAREKIRVAVPLRALPPAGVTRFALNLVEHLGKLEDCEVYVFHNDKSIENRLKNCHPIFLKGRNRIVWDYLRFPDRARRYPFDCILYPNNVIPYNHRLLDVRKINVVHDLAYFSKELNEYRTLDTLYMKLCMAASCRLADHTVAVSESTKGDLARILKVDPQKITVIHHGIEDRFRKETDAAKISQVCDRLGIETPYLFYCGSLSPRKNMLRVLMAFEQIKQRIPHRVYLAGGVSWHDGEVRRFIRRRLSDRVRHLGHLDDNDLIAMYSGADLFLYPSLYEGFGFPILEAQACGCPVLTSIAKSCPEVAGNGAVLVDPVSSDEIKAGIVSVVSDPAYRRKLIQAGYENTARFRWSRTARAYADVMS